MERLKRFLKDEDGATAVEYGLMVALIAAVVIAGATLLGLRTDDVFTTVSGSISDVTPPAAQ